jgi:cytochrome c1
MRAPQASGAPDSSRHSLWPCTACTVVLSAFLVGCMASSSNTVPGNQASTTYSAASGTPRVLAPNDSAAGQYLTVVGGCNDCHTVGWAESNGKTSPAEQLTGSPVGYRGPWGTTYAANLRSVVQRASEDRWVQILSTADGGHGRPPMPWMNTAQMSDHDLRAMYRYIHSLGAAGSPAPRGLPPGTMPTTPYINFVPVQPGSGQ